jgi:hypothetical protein
VKYFVDLSFSLNLLWIWLSNDWKSVEHK